MGFGRATGDSAGVAALTLDDGKPAVWASRFAEGARIVPLSTLERCSRSPSRRTYVESLTVTVRAN